MAETFDRNRVINDLEAVKETLDDMRDRQGVSWIDDAIAVLKAQEPRVMTLEELYRAHGTPVWKETRRSKRQLYQGWVLAYDIQKGLGITGMRLGMTQPSGRVVWYRLDDYNDTWRCWTSEPTEEQREATPWSM